jgi:hypothetical protein
LKKSIFKIAIWWITVLFLQACKSPLDGINLAFKEPVSSGKYTFYIRDFEGTVPAQMKYEILGKDKGLLVNNLNDAKITINKEGNLFMALRNDLTPKADSTLNFSVKITGDAGYSYYLKEFYIQNRGNFSTSARLGNLEKIQNGSRAFLLKKEGNTELTDNGTILIKSSFPASQKWVNLAGNTQTDEMEYLFYYFNATGKNHIPGAGSSTRPRDANGKELNYSFDLPKLDGGLYVQGVSGIKEAKQWEQPVKVELNVDTKGNETDLVFYDTYTGQVTHFGKTTVKHLNGRNYLTLDVNKPGYWYAGDIRALCREGVTFSAITPYIDLDIQYLLRVKDAETKKEVKSLYANVNLNSKFTINYIPTEVANYYVEAYDYSNYRGGNATTPFWTSKVLENCKTYSSEVMDLIKLKAPDFVEVGFVLQCPSGKTFDDTYLPKEMKAQYSLAGKNTYRDLVTFTPNTKKVKTYKLEIKQNYDFRVSTDGGATWPYKQNDYKIDNQRWTFLISAENYCK